MRLLEKQRRHVPSGAEKIVVFSPVLLFSQFKDNPSSCACFDYVVTTEHFLKVICLPAIGWNHFGWFH